MTHRRAAVHCTVHKPPSLFLVFFESFVELKQLIDTPPALAPDHLEDLETNWADILKRAADPDATHDPPDELLMS